MRRLLVALLALLIAGCASDAALHAREEHWRAFLKREAPIGTPGERALDAMRRAELNPARGAYVTVMNDGRRVSNCRDPKDAISGKEISGVKALYSRYDVEVTVCLDAAGRVEKHHVATSNQGL